MSWINKILQILKTSPGLKVLINISSVVLFGIFCNAFIIEISINGKLYWGNFYKVHSFYYLFLFSVIVFFYNYIVYRQDKTILNFIDDDYCKAYFRSEAIPELANKYTRQIKSGKKSGDLKDYHQELKKILQQ